MGRYVLYSSYCLIGALILINGLVYSFSQFSSNINQWNANNSINKKILLPPKVNPPFKELFHSFDVGTQKALAFSPDGSLLASGDGNDIRIWDMKNIAREDQEYLSLVGHKSFVRSVAFSPDGSLIASGADDRTIRIWDMTGKELFNFTVLPTTVGGSIGTVAISPYGNLLASCGHTEFVQVWDLTTQENFQNLSLPSGGINLAFSPDGKVLAVGQFGYDHSIDLWNTATWKQLPISPLIGHTGIIQHVTFSPDGSMLASSCENGKIILWNLTDGHEILDMTEHNDVVRSVDFSPIKSILVSGSYDSTIKLWNISNGNLLDTFSDFNYGIDTVVFSPDGTTLAISGGDSIKLWNFADVADPTVKPLYGHTDLVNSLKFSLDGKLLVSGSDDQLIYIWNLTAGDYPIRLPFNHKIASLTISSSALLAFCLRDTEGVYVYGISNASSIESIEESHTFDTYTKTISSVDFSPNGKLIAAGGDDNIIMVWNIITKEKHTKYDFGYLGGEFSSLEFSPDGSLLAACQETHLILWPVSEEYSNFWNHTKVFNLTSKVTSFSFSPDSSLLVSGCIDGTITIWDVLNGENISVIENTRKVNSVRFSPDLNILAICDDERIRFWNLTSGEDIQVIYGSFTTFEFSPDGQKLCAGESDGPIIQWDISPIPMDLDYDGLNDNWERQYGLDPTNFWDKFDDNDYDDLMNSMEFFLETYPNNSDSDEDGMPDDWEVLMRFDPTSDDAKGDADDDGMPNAWEFTHNFHPRDSNDAHYDPDGDWIRNVDEFKGNSNPRDFWSVPLFSLSAPHMIVLSILLILGLSVLSLLYVREKNHEALVDSLKAPDYKTAQKVRKTGFTSYPDFLKAGLYARTLLNQGKASILQGDFKNAIQQLEQAQIISERLIDLPLVAETIFNILWIKKEWGEFIVNDPTLDHFPQPSDSELTIKAFYNMIEAILAEEQKNWGLANNAWQAAMEFKDFTAEYHAICQGSLVNLEFRDWLSNPIPPDYEKLISQVEEWQEFCKNNSLIGTSCWAYLTHARIALAAMDFDEAEDWFNDCLKTAEEHQIIYYQELVQRETQVFEKHKNKIYALMK
ncbi:MAG: WD40 repeat domain-containing protein, partial [Promethearchaeota archaeon]